MTIQELKIELEKYPSDFKVVIDTSSDYEDYDEVSRINECKYGRFRGGMIDEHATPNAIILR